MNDKVDMTRSFDLRRKMIGDGISPEFFHLVDMVYPKQVYRGSKILSLWSKYVCIPNHSPIEFYIHIPFCFQKCAYCTCATKAINKKRINNYVDNLISFLVSFEEVFKNTVFRNLYIGGGTPSILKDTELDRLLEYVFKHFKFDDNGEKCCEMNPYSASKSIIDVLAKHHFSRVSIGVQSLDKEVLRQNNRSYQTYEMVKNAVLMAKQAGFKYINIDLILGLAGDTKAKLLDSFKKILEIRPATISIYPLQPTTKYLNSFFHGQLEEFDTFWSNLDKECLKELLLMADKFGFSVPDYSSLYIKPLLPSCLHYRDLVVDDLPHRYIGLGLNTSVFGIGDNAESKIDSVIKYSRKMAYRNVDSCSFVGWNMNRRAEMVSYITETLSFTKSISFDIFRNQFHSDLRDEFKIEINRLSKIGAIRLDDSNLYLETEDKKERTLYLSYFFKDEDVSKYMDFSIDKRLRAFNRITNRINDNLGDNKKASQYNGLLQKIMSLPIGNVINGVVLKRDIGRVLIADDKGRKFDILIADNCLFTCEYSLDNKRLYEEEIDVKSVLIAKRRLVFCMKKGEKNMAILVKNILPLDVPVISF